MHLRSTQLIGVLFGCVLSSLVQAQSSQQLSANDLLSLDLAQLMDVPVSSSAKKLQTLARTASAIFVISADDIRRSGKTNIPDLLRMVPGLEVASFNAHTWAVSVRGFNSVFANKLLVLLDGRNVYSWEFTGTRWYTVDTLLEDIERIEVIRGPGGTLWGANAVNGVINIISKSSKDTQGWLVSAHTGNYEDGLSARYGGQFDELGQNTYRVFVKRHDRDSFPNAVLDDSWQQETAGMRLDGQTEGEYRWRVTADITRNTLQDAIWETRQATTSDTENAHILARLGNREDAENAWHLQAYYQYADLTLPVSDYSETFDLEWQQRFPAWQNHDVIVGSNLRYLYNRMANENGFSLEDTTERSYLASAFIEDEITLVPNRWALVLGSKIEYYRENGSEFLPTARLLWTPNEKNTGWATISRAARTATRLEQDFRVELPVAPQVNLVYAPNDDIGSELLTAYELGWRQQTTNALSWDLVGFYHHYQDTMHRVEQPIVQQNGITFIEYMPFNLISGDILGTELAVNWQPRQDLLLQLAHTYLHTDIDPLSANDPKNQFSLRVGWEASPQFSVDLWARYVGKVCHFASPTYISSDDCISDYTGFDARLAWQFSPQLELSLVGQNLLDDQHLEFETDGSDGLLSEVPRQVYLQVRWEME